MNARTPFWPLLRWELGSGRFGSPIGVAYIFLVSWFCVGTFPLLSFRVDNPAGNIAVLFDAGQFPIVGSIYLGVLIVCMAFVAVPAFAELTALSCGMTGGLPPTSGFEFLFTRAIDRRKLFRARTVALFILAIAPLFLNLLASPLAPEIIFASKNPEAPAAVARQEHYQAAFPGSHPRTVGGVVMPGQLVIPLGAEAYTAWLAWSGALIFLLLLGYNSLVAGCIQSGLWRAILILFAPIPVLVLLTMLSLRRFGESHINLYEASFLFFSVHWIWLVPALVAFAWAVQTWCERRLSRLEVF